MSRIRTMIPGLLLAFAPVAAFAQTPQTVSARIVTLSWGENLKGLWYLTKDGPRIMEAYSRGLTSPVDYTGPATIHLHPDAGIFVLPPEKRPAPLAIARLPSSGGDFLLIFTPREKKEAGWDVRVIDNSPENFPAGSYRFLNLTGSPLRIALDGSTGSVGASSSAVLRPAQGGPVRDLEVRFALGGEIIYSSIWGHEEKRRGNVFIVPDPRGRNGIGVRQFYQAVVAPEPRP